MLSGNRLRSHVPHRGIWFFLLSFIFLSFAGALQAKKHHHHYDKRHHTGAVVHKKETLSKKPHLIQNTVQQHTPPVGHDGEERSDWFWQRRAWPSRTIDPGAYPTALDQARRMPIYISPYFSRRGQGVVGALSSATWQPIGPYSIDGRASAIATDPKDSNTFYIGAAAGGLWKTTDHGNTWACMTDTFGSLSIGCVTIDTSNPQIIYIGLGECNGSSDSYPGEGLWKSTNGGATWNYLGFAAAQYIAKVIIDPRNDRNLFVAVLGPNSLTDTNKGIFRSTDGGATWTRSLFVRPTTSDCVGFIDIAMDPLNSANLVAAAFDHSITIGANFYPGGPAGPSTGIYRSSDTGNTWVRVDTLSNSGLPNCQSEHVFGRIALLWVSWPDFTQTRDEVFAGFIRADTNPVTHFLTDENFEGLYASQDGLHWTKVLDSTIKIPMGGVQGKDSANITNAQGGYNFYLTTGPDPVHQWPDIYLGCIDIFRSSDVAGTWQDITNSYSQYYVKDNREQHSDQHGVAFAGTDLIAVSDGGVFETHDYGTNWRQMTGLPITMFYAIEPWRAGMANTPSTISPSDLKVFGGTQDNGTVGNLLDTGFAWINHGDGETAISHPTDSNKLISSLQYGVIFARNTLDSLVPMPLGMKDSMHDSRPRWHTITYRLLYGPRALTDTQEVVAWNAPIALDDNNPSELYTGRCHVYRASLDWNDLESMSWQTWSPQIAGYPGKDSVWGYGDIECIALGTTDAGGHRMIWAGGNDLLWRTEVDPNLNDTGMPHWVRQQAGIPAGVVSAIVPDRSDSLTAFCSIVSASNVAHILKTTNGGKKWTNISGNLPVTPVSALVIDTLTEHGDPALKNQALIVGTDVGVFVTTNGGVSWSQLGTGMPHSIVSDLKIYKNILVAATHGRSLYAIDISGIQAVPASVTMVSPFSITSISIYPNPVVGGEAFSVSATGVFGNVTSCRLIEASTGRTFPARIEATGAGEYHIKLNSPLSAGTYFIELFQDNTLLGRSSVTLMR